MRGSISSPFPGPILYYEEASSTMDLAQRAVEEGLDGASLEGAVFWAGYQRAGRGRLEGRSWESPPGEGLLFTVLISQRSLRIPMTAFPLVAGLSLALTLESFGLKPQIKWPNDLLIRERKAAGILCETQGPWLSAGIGLNLAQGRFPQGLAEKAVSMGQLLSRPPGAEKVLEKFLFHFHDVLKGKDWQSPVESRLFRRGDFLEVELGLPGGDSPKRSGILEGIGPRGELILREPGGSALSVFSCEVMT